MNTCDYSYGLNIVCGADAEVTLNGEPLCADHLHLYFPAEVESGHADSIPGVLILA